MNAEPQHKHRKYWLLCLFAVFIAILGVSLPEIEPTPLTYINASDITTTGATAVGSLQNITEINHGYYNVTEINAQPYYVIVNFTNVTNFSFLEAKAKYYSTSGTPSTHVVDIEIFCHTDMDYEDVFFLENAAEWRYFTRHFPDSSHFIMNGNVSIKFNHSSNGNVNHRLLIDVVRLIILPQYAQNTVTLNQYFNTSGVGCTGNCSFNNLTVNSLGKNNTLDTYTDFIHLNSPFKDVINNTESFIDLRNSNTYLGVTNNSNGNTSDIIFSPDYAAISVSNGFLNSIEITLDKIRFLSNSVSMTFNGTYLDLGGANLTNCSNCGSASDNTKVNKTGDTLSYILNLSTINNNTVVYNDVNNTIHYNKILHYINGTGSDINANLNDEVFSILYNLNPQNTVAGLVSFQQVTNTSFPFFAARRARGSVFKNGTAYPSSLIDGDTVFRVSATGFTNDAWQGSRAAIDFITVKDWNSTSQGMKIDFLTTQNYTTSFTKRMTIWDNGSIQIYSFVGAGIVYVDDNGLLQKVTAPTGTGNVYTCWNKSTKQPFFGTPGC